VKTKQDTDLYGYYAGFVSRLLAFIIDILVLIVATTLITWLLTFVSLLLPFETELSGSVLSLIVTTLLNVGFYAGYFLFFWTLNGQTPGKMLMGLRVVTTDGQYISFGQAVRRLIGYFVAAFPLYLGFFWILVDDRRQGWQDKIAGTCVVYTWHARPDETFFRRLLES
jgi:uncharacterized RDD family membrane protein YckC